MIKTITYDMWGYDPHLNTFPKRDIYVNQALMNAFRTQENILEIDALKEILNGDLPDIILDYYEDKKVSAVFFISGIQIIKWGFISNDNLITQIGPGVYKFKDMSDMFSLPLWDSVSEALDN